MDMIIITITLKKIRRENGVGIEFTKKDHENVIDFRWSDIWGEDEEDIVKANFIENFLQNKLMKIFFKWATGGLLDY